MVVTVPAGKVPPAAGAVDQVNDKVSAEGSMVSCWGVPATASG
jgi:hypothetical protein